MKTAIAPIETSYAGCRFRSRLEARWAVFFDTLNIPWLYEPQGYTVGPEATPYLPDFWLPDPGLWVEVKGKLGDGELKTLIWAASGAGLPLRLGAEGTGVPGRWGRRLLMLGQVPEPGTPWLHHCLELIAGDLVVASPATIVKMPKTSRTLGLINVYQPTLLNGVLAGEPLGEKLAERFVDGMACPLLAPSYSPADAYRAARSARFEHGESGSPT